MTFQKYRLDVLTTELWETRGEQGHILGSDVSNRYFWKVMGSTPVGGSEKSFSEYDLRTLLRYLHFIQVTIHLSGE